MKGKAGRGGWAPCRRAGRAATRGGAVRRGAERGAAGRSGARGSRAAGGAEASGRDWRRRKRKADWQGPLINRPGER
jgi:hypothetical protein